MLSLASGCVVGLDSRSYGFYDDGTSAARRDAIRCWTGLQLHRRRCADNDGQSVGRRCAAVTSATDAAAASTCRRPCR